MRSAALKAYQVSLRATGKAFRGDAEVLAAARLKVKQGFIENKDLKSPQKEEEIEKLNEISMFLRKNIVQGQKTDDGKYYLNFTQETELGDNDTIKQSKKDMGSLAGKKGATIKKCS